MQLSKELVLSLSLISLDVRTFNSYSLAEKKNDAQAQPQNVAFLDQYMDTFECEESHIYLQVAVFSPADNMEIIWALQGEKESPPYCSNLVLPHTRHFHYPLYYARNIGLCVSSCSPQVRTQRTVSVDKML